MIASWDSRSGKRRQTDTRWLLRCDKPTHRDLPSSGTNAWAEQFFDLAAEVGLTKHLQGLEATEKLIELCHRA